MSDDPECLNEYRLMFQYSFIDTVDQSLFNARQHYFPSSLSPVLVQMGPLLMFVTPKNSSR